MPARASHIAVLLLTLCYGSVNLAEPLEIWARIIFPGAKPQRITSAKTTKPISGASYVVARRHLPLTKQIELPPHDAVVAERHVRAADVAFVPLLVRETIAEADPPPPLYSRPPPLHMTIG